MPGCRRSGSASIDAPGPAACRNARWGVAVAAIGWLALSGIAHAAPWTLSASAGATGTYNHYIAFQNELRVRIGSRYYPLEIDYMIWNMKGASIGDAIMLNLSA